MKQFFGKYRGKVTNNLDPMKLGRVQVEVPAVLGTGRTSWAMPCVPYAGMQVGFFAMPTTGTNVWVEFEGGDPDYPIWSGCFWGMGELPVLATAPTVKLLQLPGISVLMNELTSTVKVGVGGTPVEPLVSLTMNPQAVEIDYAKTLGLTMGAGTVEISNGETTALKMLPTGIELASPPLSLKVDASGTAVTVSNGPTTVKVAPDSVQLTQATATVKVAAAGIEVTNAPASIKVAPSGVELSAGGAQAQLLPAPPGLIKINSGGAGSIQILPTGVNVNNGALEVT
ncbi:MAG: phage baseplate assembly protein V [Cyanobacteria bacterium P01_D01_bin.44]